ncbi:MAG TPA: L-threonylcarbamoyladenylate synthase [Nitrospirota bacterium]
MRAEIVKIDPTRPETAFSRCRGVIFSGGVIVYPTDTFYGLGSDPKNPAALRRLFEIKGRRTDQPILLLISGPAEVMNWAAEVTPRAEELMKRFWPGPLTLVFKAKANVAPELTAGTCAIGLRVPGSGLTRELLRSLGIALTGTSANRSGGPDPRTAEEAAASLGAAVNLILDGGAAPGGKPSTVVDVRSDRPRVLREGAVPSRDITG